MISMIEIRSSFDGAIELTVDWKLFLVQTVAG